MYRGKRDPMVGILVRQDMCSAFTDHSGCEWIEIFVPPADWRDYAKPWPSIALPPSQVFWVDDIYNEFQVNAGAMLTLLYKAFTAMGSRIPIGREEDLVENIRARYLMQARHMLFGDAGMGNLTVSAVRDEFEASGMTMLGYVNRMRMEQVNRGAIV